jgi:hypothetical protein
VHIKIEIKTYQREIMNKSLIRVGLNVVTAFVALQFMCLPAAAQVSKEVLDSISTPDQVETSIGTLEFLDGAPLPETAERVYDYLDTTRGFAICRTLGRPDPIRVGRQVPGPATRLRGRGA